MNPPSIRRMPLAPKSSVAILSNVIGIGGVRITRDVRLVLESVLNSGRGSAW